MPLRRFAFPPLASQEYKIFCHMFTSKTGVNDQHPQPSTDSNRQPHAQDRCSILLSHAWTHLKVHLSPAACEVHFLTCGVELHSRGVWGCQYCQSRACRARWCAGRHRGKPEKTDGFGPCICLQNCLQRFEGLPISFSYWSLNQFLFLKT